MTLADHLANSFSRYSDAMLRIIATPPAGIEHPSSKIRREIALKELSRRKKRRKPQT